MSEDRRVTLSSGNVFADLGFDEPDTELAKADLALTISRIIRARGWTQDQAAEQLGIDQPKVSKLVRGRLGEFSIERLMRFLTKLDQDVAITVQPKSPERELAAISVHRRHPAIADGPIIEEQGPTEPGRGKTPVGRAPRLIEIAAVEPGSVIVDMETREIVIKTSARLNALGLTDDASVVARSVSDQLAAAIG